MGACNVSSLKRSPLLSHSPVIDSKIACIVLELIPWEVNLSQRTKTIELISCIRLSVTQRAFSVSSQIRHARAELIVDVARKVPAHPPSIVDDAGIGRRSDDIQAGFIDGLEHERTISATCRVACVERITASFNSECSRVRKVVKVVHITMEDHGPAFNRVVFVS